MFHIYHTLRCFALTAALLCFGFIPNATLYAAPTALDAAFNCSLPAPGNLIVTSVSINSISVDWDDVPGATGYLVRATNALTGQLYYTATTGNSFDTATGLPSATDIEISVQAICPGGSLGAEATIVAKTEFIVLDDVVAARLKSNQINCHTPLEYGEILVVTETPLNNEVKQTLFLVSDNVPEADYGVVHDNTNNGEWAFANNHGEVPIGTDNWVKANTVLVFKNQAMVMAFTITNTNPLMICELTSWNGQQINSNGVYKIWQTSDVGGDGGNGSSGSGFGSRVRQTSTFTPTISAGPNPFREMLNVQVAGAGTETGAHMELMDANGRVVRAQAVAAGAQSASLETADLMPGLYLLRYRNTTTVQTIKVVKGL